ncbi:sigma-70 family RNA polymerase sigma factor [Carboxylicivirga sp. RSCT41]|uniref:sigma-70 family RNA polymerase sigma factor n=1 Tax=Carboxylicivirga agarovorans TaxID=3417570 RepID=UPI003D34C82F
MKNSTCNFERCQPQQIVADFYDKILGYVVKKVSDAEMAKDITQEVMGRMIDAYSKKKTIENVKAWLFQVSRNVIADRYRKDAPGADYEDVEALEQAEEPDITTEDFIIPMINLLPDEYRVPLYMSDIDNVKQADIALQLNISLSAAKMRCQRGRKKLQEMFFECCDIQYTESGAFAGCTIKSSCSVLLEEEQKLIQKRNRE